MEYDPSIALNHATWVTSLPVDRRQAVRDYHRRVPSRVVDEGAHVALHYTAEMALAYEQPGAAECLAELMRRGLDRHEAVHRLGAILGRISDERHGRKRGRKARGVSVLEKEIEGLGLEVDVVLRGRLARAEADAAVRCVADPRDKRRRRAIRLLVRLGEDAVQPVLDRFVVENNLDVRVDLLAILASLGMSTERIFEMLVRRLPADPNLARVRSRDPWQRTLH